MLFIDLPVTNPMLPWVLCVAWSREGCGAHGRRVRFSPDCRSSVGLLPRFGPIVRPGTVSLASFSAIYMFHPCVPPPLSALDGPVLLRRSRIGFSDLAVSMSVHFPLVYSLIKCHLDVCLASGQNLNCHHSYNHLPIRFFLACEIRSKAVCYAKWTPNC